MSSLLLGALLGFLGSLLAALYYDRATQPYLEVVPDTDPPVTGNQPHVNFQHQFLEIKVRQRKGLPGFPIRRPAWRCRVTFDVFRDNGTRPIRDRITARWSGSLEPYRTQLTSSNTLVQIPESSMLPLGQSFDVHGTGEEKIGVALKYEGYDHCWIFSNESYQQAIPWEKPEWKLDVGRYYIRAITHYESTLGEHERTWWLLLRNDGKKFSEWGISMVAAPPFAESRP